MTRKTETLHEDVSTFVISQSIFLRMFQKKLVEKIGTSFYVK